MKKVIFIDRDGTIIHETEDEQIDSFEKMRFLPGAITNLAKIAAQTDYLLVMVTNQDGLGSHTFPEQTFWPVHNKMLEILEGEGIHFHEILIDRTWPADNAPTRKPGTAMLTHYLKGHYDLENSVVIGDRATDVALAKNIGCKAIFIGDNTQPHADLCTNSWSEISSYLMGQSRRARVIRKTSETEIQVSLNLDGRGVGSIHTGLGFFDHMLEQLSRHGGIDLELKVNGDLQIDEHHTIEDTALALGEAFNRAIGSAKGTQRYGFLLPMDDALAQVAIDFGGRPGLEWNVNFTREKIGDMPTEMFRHFFKSFCDGARCNINIKAEGENEHHKIESVFKAWARAVRMAITRTGEGVIPSTKGVL